MALLDGEIPQSGGGGSDGTPGAEDSGAEVCAVDGSAGCSASSLVGEAVTVTVLGEGCSEAPSLVEQETSTKPSRAVAIMVKVRSIATSPPPSDSSSDRTPVIDCRKW